MRRQVRIPLRWNVKRWDHWTRAQHMWDVYDHRGVFMDCFLTWREAMDYADREARKPRPNRVAV